MTFGEKVIVHEKSMYSDNTCKKASEEEEPNCLNYGIQALTGSVRDFMIANLRHLIGLGTKKKGLFLFGDR